MGIKDLWDKITGNTGPKLAKASGEIAQHKVEHLDVFTAEAMVIVEIAAADVDTVLAIARSTSPGALVSDSTTVIFVPTQREVLPVKDPKKGWILPLDSEVANKLSATPGDYEINPQIAFVVTS
ncbi:hypothetical protein [Corynebacterium ammoniagenes]|uniref:Uncharacterized protein n=2 Tax=Corynebacterium ammoniagenes TaxID=1697 RepID=A0AAV5G957_CORAM|nr:hypothetical protein [Corynebacterium ammoniagenes]APT83081.1 hypothetical protein CAMM_09195 [Corynebacterium ammoniagenes DSM 20306]AQS74114.1 hypothetical protein CA40472_09515 [Corynebacterium ammoniagenes]EFG82022.1 hypothetical protein HMPREF0281_00729 [Corynebacterium ammoniagenes DSM 20306]NMF31284.1 hypothetical protein [Corynebacterium ammoniagenes]GJN42645.1 hypothetical protein CAT723_11240 [Corynebacterium ammoniagenes]